MASVQVLYTVIIVYRVQITRGLHKSMWAFAWHLTEHTYSKWVAKAKRQLLHVSRFCSQTPQEAFRIILNFSETPKTVQRDTYRERENNSPVIIMDKVKVDPKTAAKSGNMDPRDERITQHSSESDRRNNAGWFAKLLCCAGVAGDKARTDEEDEYEDSGREEKGDPGKGGYRAMKLIHRKNEETTYAWLSPKRWALISSPVIACDSFRDFNVIPMWYQCDLILILPWFYRDFNVFLPWFYCSFLCFFSIVEYDSDWNDYFFSFMVFFWKNIAVCFAS